MKAILVGLGNFGFSWYKDLRRHPGISKLSVVESNIQMRDKIDQDVPFFQSMEESISAERPDFVVNVTPPRVHSSINEIAFSYRLPVMCEKPISHSMSNAKYIVAQAEKYSIPFMITENYRFFSAVRKAKEILDRGEIGEISTVKVVFSRYHPVSAPYFLEMENPLLEDIAIHHFDLIRHLTGQEAKTLFAQNSNPPGSWSANNIHLNALLEMESGIIVNYNASMMSRGKQTEWYGDWQFEGSKGVLALTSRSVQLSKENSALQDEIHEFKDFGNFGCIDEFLSSLKENREPRPSGKDYLKSQGLVYVASVSSKAGKMLNVKETLNEVGND